MERMRLPENPHRAWIGMNRRHKTKILPAGMLLANAPHICPDPGNAIE